VVDISHPDFEEQINVVKETLIEIEAANKPTIIVFNKIDAYTWIEKDEDDLTPTTHENVSLDELKNSWMGKGDDQVIFISALQKSNWEELRKLVYDRVREIHVKRYPYNNFLY
jgi:GTP-binding protein HflX